MRPTRAAALVAVLLAAACGPEEAPPPPAAPASPAAPAAPPAPPGRFHFTDRAKEAGLVAPSWCGGKEKPHLLDSQGNGLALLDYDGDGDLDLYQVRGWRTEPGKVVEKCRNLLWRNRGDGTFEDATDAAGVGDDGWGCGAAVGDVDGDGRPDLFVTNFGPDVLYRNRGDGTFERVKDPPGIDGWSTAAVFLDAEGDGDDDLFVAAYIECTLREVLDAKATLEWQGLRVAPGPFGLPGKANAFFRNEGGGRFVDATAASGLEDKGRFYSFAAAAFDYDGDLDPDLYVANDSNPNYLYRNEGNGVFREVAPWSGCAYNEGGIAQAGMGVAVGDHDGDLLPDIFVTNFSRDTSTLYRNLGKGLFADVSSRTGVVGPTYTPLSWGCAFADFDLDGDEDLFEADGHIYPQAEAGTSGRESFRQRNVLLENEAGVYRDASKEAGPGLAVVESSRGVAVGDLDGDGDLDLVVSNVDAPPTLLRNDSPRGGAWLVVEAPGAVRVEVEAGGRKQARWRVAGGSFCSESDRRFHFGLGDAKTVDRVRASWRDGRETVVENPAPDRILKVSPK